MANLTYDVQGNLASKGSQTYQFDLGNRLRSVPGQETGYEYDGHGRRVFVQTVGSGQVLSQYGNDGKLLYQNDARHGRRTDYVYLGNRLVAYRERPLSSSTATVKYQHVDALGTPIAVTNAAKATIETGEYEPYGRLVNKPLFDGPGYTGHVQDAATGLTYMQQRYYDPLLGVFLSVDPVTAYDEPMTQFHRYRYANNNPYKFVDPDGRVVVIAGTEEEKKALVQVVATLRSRPAGQALYEVLDGSRFTHTVQVPDHSKDERNSTQATSWEGHLDESGNPGEGSGSTILVDPNPDHPVKLPFVSLAHEMGHARAMDAGVHSRDLSNQGPGTTPPGEVQALEAENAVRSEHGMEQREHYYPKGD